MHFQASPFSTVHLSHLESGPGSASVPDDLYMPDSLASQLIIFSARNSKVPGLEALTNFDNIAEDVTSYFLVMFHSHFVLIVLTLNPGRASATVSLSRYQAMTCITWFSRQRSNFFQAREPSLSRSECDPPHAVLHCIQWCSCVASMFCLWSLTLMIQ